MQLRRRDRAISLELPCENIGELFVITQCFPIWRLVFLAEMATA
jgi:hypothetical protein